MYEEFEHRDLKSLRKRKRLSEYSLLIVWIGGIFGISSSVSTFINTGSFHITTLVISVIALIASIPVYLEKQKITKTLKSKSE